MNKQNPPKNQPKKQKAKKQPKVPRAAAKNTAKKGLVRNQEGPSIAPIAVSNKQAFPLRGVAARRSWRFENSELVGSVNNSTGFVATRYYVNPGMPGTFPWLSVEAKDKWDQYRFHRIRFRYVTRTASTTVGSVILSPEYNVRDPPPVTEQQATDTMGAVEDSPWKEICCDLDVSAMYPSGPRKLIRGGNVAGDTNLYDSAIFYMCTTDGADTSLIGKLWVDYDVELFVPQNSPAETGKTLITSFGGRVASQTLVNNVISPIMWDALTNDPLGIGSPVSGVFTPAAGTYRISVQTIVSDSTAETFEGSMELVKNGVSLVPRAASTFNLSIPAGGDVTLNASGFASFSGTDTFSVSVLLLGAAGTLTVTANNSLISFQSA